MNSQERVACHQCGQEYKNLGQHWSIGSCEYPELTPYQEDLVTGLMLSDAGVYRGSGNNPYFVLCMITIPFLEWFDSQMGILTTEPRLIKTAEELVNRSVETGFNPGAVAENYHDFWGVYSRRAPCFEQFRDWYQDDGKHIPEDVELSPTVLKMWVAGDGSKSCPGRCTRPYIEIGSEEQMERPERINQLFDSISVNPTWCGGKFQFSCDDSEFLYEYMGSPPPGFEYKWPNDSA